ncbi:GTPase IMAP family member 4 [Bagarius yarrelli]|uniref:GTPase IMAP family member 4 n=1 Tax=Bagarius yarrelli TaxID=175774 RepID=A0A556TL77_BAGYA|nr:GTPase IMAP family member 4 [Bagarius yarrelli]
MLLGHRGVGKSATANLILGKEAFREIETTQCEIHIAKTRRGNILVIDTPGINNPSFTAAQWRKELKCGVMLSSPGPHVFLLVIKVGIVSEEDRNAVKWIREYFGEAALKFSMILFIGREEITNRQWVAFSKDARTLDLLSNYGGRYCVINSKKESDSSQVLKLLLELETMIKLNRDEFYTPEMYEAVASRIEKTEVIQMKENVTIWHKPILKQFTNVEVHKKKGIGFDVKHENLMPPKKQEEPVRSLPDRKTVVEVKLVKEDLRRQEEIWIAKD